jgi:hypothetical protein
MTDTALKPGDRIEVVVKVASITSFGGVVVQIDGADAYALFRPETLLAHGTRLPPLPKPLQVGETVRHHDGIADGIARTIVAIAGDFAWCNEGDRYWTFPLSDLTRIEDSQ